MAPRKSRTCTVCNEVFQRAHSVTMHMRTTHEDYVEKLVCTVCKQYISTMSNLRVHLKREGQRNKRKYKLHNEKIDGQLIKHVWVPATLLPHGRYNRLHFSDDSSDYSDTDNLPLATLVDKGKF